MLICGQLDSQTRQNMFNANRRLSAGRRRAAAALDWAESEKQVRQCTARWQASLIWIWVMQNAQSCPVHASTGRAELCQTYTLFSPVFGLPLLCYSPARLPRNQSAVPENFSFHRSPGGHTHTQQSVHPIMMTFKTPKSVHQAPVIFCTTRSGGSLREPYLSPSHTACFPNHFWSSAATLHGGARNL